MPDKPARRRPKAPAPLAVITASLGLFFVILTLLAIQVRSGRDPALGPGLVSPAAISKPAAGTTGATTTTAAQEAAGIVTKTSPPPPP
jgi:hypothetical protein